MRGMALIQQLQATSSTFMLPTTTTAAMNMNMHEYVSSSSYDLPSTQQVRTWYVRVRTCSSAYRKTTLGRLKLQRHGLETADNHGFPFHGHAFSYGAVQCGDVLPNQTEPFGLAASDY